MWKLRPHSTAPTCGSSAEPSAIAAKSAEVGTPEVKSGIFSWGMGGEEAEGLEEDMKGISRAESSEAMPDSPRMKIFGVEAGRERIWEM